MKFSTDQEAESFTKLNAPPNNGTWLFNVCCDLCDKKSEVVPASIQGARKRAAKEGFLHIDGIDYCADCSPKGST